MRSDAPCLSIRSEPDVQITIYDAAGIKQHTEAGEVERAMSRGLYRLHLDRCGFICDHVIVHDSSEPRSFGGPLLDSPAPIAIVRDAAYHAELAQRFSAKDHVSAGPLGDAPHDARLFVFVRRVNPGASMVAVPSEPIAIHDRTGRQLVVLGPDSCEHNGDAKTGYLALSCRIAPGTYLIRVGRRRRDLAITVPAGRTAHVFLADNGAISLRTARVYLPGLDDAFDPGGSIARAMESVLWVLSQRRGELPRIADGLRQLVDHDLSFGIACAHLARSQRERDAVLGTREDQAPGRQVASGRDPDVFDRIMGSLLDHAREIPDVAILSRACGDPQRAASLSVLTAPPLFRASLVLALEQRVPVAPRSALLQATKTGHDDSVWCTWSPRWWDERWIEPTVDRLWNHHDRDPGTVEQIANATHLPIDIVDATLTRLDAGLSGIEGKPIEQLSIEDYVLGEVVGRGRHGIVRRARRNGACRDVAIKVVQASSRDAADRLARELWKSRRHRHRHLLQIDRSDALPDDGGVWLEMELCRGTLFDRLAALGGVMPVDEACHLVLQALDALAHLHAQGVIHGDIHPGTLLLREDGTIALKLPPWPPDPVADPARPNSADEDVARFMAPEAVLDAAAMTAASDVWSTAATLYFLLTLELPRERYADQGEPEAVRDNESVAITDRLSATAELPVACIARALSPQVDARLGHDGACQGRQRFRDAKEFRDALSRELVARRSAVQATRLYDELVAGDRAHVATIRNVFLRMSEVVDGVITPRRVLRDELVFADPAEDRRVEEVLRRFGDSGLIKLRVEDVANGRAATFVELVHDELLDGWSRIRHRFDEFDAVPESRGLVPELGNAVRSWKAGARARSLLWSDRRAESAEAIRRDQPFVFTPSEEEFVHRSRRKRRILRIGLPAGLSAVVALVLAFTGCVYWQREAAIDSAAAAATARAARDEVQQVLARSLQESGRQRLLDGRPFQALPYLLAAGQAGEVGPVLQMLVRAATRRLSLVGPLEHGGSVKYAAFSPDGSRVVTTSSDATAGVWDTSTGRRIASFAHRGTVSTAMFSPDGTAVVTASEDRTARIWDAATGRPLSPALEHDDFVQSAVFSADGRHVVTASLDHTARIWDARTGAREHTLMHRDAVWSATFSADGACVVTASQDHTARIWNAATGEAVAPALDHRDTVWSAVFSSDGTRVVTASQDHTAQVWDATTGKAVTAPLVHRDGVTGAVFDLTGRYVLTASHDGTARVWNAVTGESGEVLEHDSSVMRAAFSPDGTRIVTASSDAMARIWETRTGRLIGPLLEHTGPVASAVFSADGARIVTASFDGTARVWNATDDDHAVPLAVPGPVQQAAFNPDGTRVVTASDDQIGRIWDTRTGTLVTQLTHPAVVRTVAFSANGKQIVSTSNDRAVQIWDVATGSRVTVPFMHPGRVTSATFSPDGTRVVIAGGDDDTRWGDTLRIWDVTSGSQILLSLEYPDRLVSARLSHDGTRLVALNQDRTARIWYASTGKAITPPLDQGGMTGVAFSPDGTRVVTASEDHTARVWDTATGKLVAPPLEHQAAVVCASFSPDGARVVTASEDRTVRVWDAITGKPLTPPLFHDEPIVNAAFSNDGGNVVTVDRHVVRTWDVSLDKRSMQDWASVANLLPYVLEDGVLMLRSAVRVASR